MSLNFQCPSCDERKRLRGRREEPLVHIACQACGHEWVHDPWACPTCGGRMYSVRRPLLQKARGTQASIIGYSTVKACPHCDPDADEKGEGWLSPV